MVGVNTLAVLVLLWLVLGDFIKSHEGSYMTWIQIEGHGGAWTTYFGIEILPLIALATIFLVTQIYLNLRLIQRNSAEKKDSQNARAGEKLILSKMNMKGSIRLAVT